MTTPFLWVKTPAEATAFWSDLRASEAKREAFQQAANAAVADAVGRFHERSPYADPGVALAAGQGAARGIVNPDQVAQAVDQSVQQGSRPAWSAADSQGLPSRAQQIATSDPLVLGPDGKVDVQATLKAAGVPAQSGTGGFNPLSPGDYLDAAYSGVKGAVREGLSVAQSSWEEVQNRGAQAAHAVGDVGSSLKAGDLGGAGSAFLRAEAMAVPFSASSLATTGGGSVGQAIESTKGTNLIQQFHQAAQLGSVDLGSGFFPAGTVTDVWQPEAARQVRGTINGSAWTFGRQIASTFAQPGSKQYGIMSGLIDGAAMWAFDPSLALQDALTVPKTAKVFEAAAKAEPSIAEAVDGIRGASTGVLVDAERQTMNAVKADQFLDYQHVQPFLNRLAETSDPIEVAKRLGPHAPPSLISAVTKTGDVDAVKQALRNELGMSIASTDDLPGLRFGYDLKRQVLHALPGYDTAANAVGAEVSRATARVPSRGFPGFLPGATDREMRQALNATDDWARLAKLPYEDRSRLYGVISDGLASGSAEGRYQAVSAWADTMRHGLVNLGLPGGDEAAKQITTLFKDRASSLYGIDRLGRPADWDFIATATGNADLTMASPSLLSQEMGSLITMPDPREIRRLTSKYGRLISDVRYDAEHNVVRAKNLKFPLSVAQALGEDIFPKMAIARAATAIRVTMDEQLRLAATGMPNMLSHPIQWFGLVAGSKADLARLGMDEGTIRQMIDESAGSIFTADSADKALRYTRATGMWTDVEKGDKWLSGAHDMSYQFFHDPIAQRIFAGETDDQIMTWLKSPEGRKTFDRYTELGKGAVSRSADTGQLVPSPVDLTDDNVLRGWIGRNIRGQVSDFAGQNAVLRDAIGRNVLPDGTAAFEDGQATRGFKNVLKDWMEDPASPERVKYNPSVTLSADAPNKMQQFNKGMDWVMGKMFNLPVKTLTRSPAFRDAFFERVAEMAPQLHPDEANKLLRTIESTAGDNGFAGKIGEFLGGDKRLDRVISQAGAAHGDLALEDVFQYAKGHALDEVHNLLFDSAMKSNLEQSLRMVAPFAMAWREILTNWTKVLAKNPGFIRRAQMTVEGARGSGFFYTDPTSGREVFAYPGSDWLVKAITGGGVATALAGTAGMIPGVGPAIKGGIEKATSVIPGVGDLTGASGGLPGSMPLVGDVQGLNLVSGSLLPGLNPVVQFPMAEILKNKPWADSIRGLLLPYGVPTDENTPALGQAGAYLLPGWMQKVVSAITTSPDSASSYGNTYAQTLQVLAASGKYGTSMPERRRMIEDAQAKARTLTVLRGLGQFVAPASPSYAPSVATADGDKLITELSKEAHELQAKDYDHWVQNFVSIFGEGPFTAAMSKTRAANGGLDASTAFGNWETEHSGVMSNYPAVAGYFAPVGSDFDSEVYNRQVATGERKRLSADEMVNAAQATIAKWKYDQAKQVVGTRPSIPQQQWLSNVKAKLQDEYPGYAVEPSVQIADLPVKIEQLERAATDPSLKGDIQTGVATYLHLRDRAIETAKARGSKGAGSLQGQNMADLRAWLGGAATAIIAKYPTFSRLYDSVLSAEVDQ